MNSIWKTQKLPNIISKQSSTKRLRKKKSLETLNSTFLIICI